MLATVAPPPAHLTPHEADGWRAYQLLQAAEAIDNALAAVRRARRYPGSNRALDQVEFKLATWRLLNPAG